jgi:hypothetical protein
MCFQAVVDRRAEAAVNAMASGSQHSKKNGPA